MEPTPERHQAISQNTGLAEADVRRLLLAFRHGGTAGVHAAVGATPLAGKREAEAALQAARSAAAEFDAAAGIVTDPVIGVQIRHGPDDRWYPFTRSGQRWWPASGASPQPDAAFAAAMRARRARLSPARTCEHSFHQNGRWCLAQVIGERAATGGTPSGP